MNKDKKRFLREAMMARGQFRDMCRDCSLKGRGKDWCDGCCEAWRKLPGWPVEYFKTPGEAGRA